MKRFTLEYFDGGKARPKNLNINFFKRLIQSFSGCF